MADNRALMAAFQKVRADVDQALEQTRRKEGSCPRGGRSQACSGAA